ncbi:hypothetical protein BKA70DRAFT_1215822 [Coprinopsis sp. MPI-PUGE-AT-0042]|nr:hypothetical protein BKA70DRAFT_1215822 [Coprinopsis sp. MPI-PUGE-AT-0042]
MSTRPSQSCYCQKTGMGKSRRGSPSELQSNPLSPQTEHASGEAMTTTDALHGHVLRISPLQHIWLILMIGSGAPPFSNTLFPAIPEIGQMPVQFPLEPTGEIHRTRAAFTGRVAPMDVMSNLAGIGLVAAGLALGMIASLLPGSYLLLIQLSEPFCMMVLNSIFEWISQSASVVIPSSTPSDNPARITSGVAHSGRREALDGFVAVLLEGDPTRS